MSLDQDQHMPEPCSQCGGQSFHHAQVRSAFWSPDDRLVVVEDIPAFVCGTCQERFYDDVTVTELDLLRGQGFPPDDALGEIRVPVFSLSREKRRKRAS
jgi:YgiT-type zinc finger domain-containing protein